MYQQEDRENVLRSRASGKGVLTAPFRLVKTNRLGVILTFAVYKADLPSNVTRNERIQATDGYASSLGFLNPTKFPLPPTKKKKRMTAVKPAYVCMYICMHVCLCTCIVHKYVYMEKVKWLNNT